MLKTGGIEPVRILVLDKGGVPLSGKSDIKISIQRASDDLFFDWNDETFKASPAQGTQTLIEVGTSGEYKLNTVQHVNGFNTSRITNSVSDDTYYFRFMQDGGYDAGNLPVMSELQVGRMADDVTLILGLVQNNFVLDRTTYNTAGLMVSGRIRIFSTAAAAAAATDNGTGEGELAAFNITSVAENAPYGALPKMYKVVKE